jgi:hypothetical protein
MPQEQEIKRFLEEKTITHSNGITLTDEPVPPEYPTIRSVVRFTEQNPNIPNGHARFYHYKDDAVVVEVGGAGHQLYVELGTLDTFELLVGIFKEKAKRDAQQG